MRSVEPASRHVKKDVQLCVVTSDIVCEHAVYAHVGFSERTVKTLTAKIRDSSSTF